MSRWTRVEAYPYSPIMRKAEMRDTPVPASKRRRPLSPKGKITLQGDELWIVRSQRHRTNGKIDTAYYVTTGHWNRSPMNATIFTDYGAAAYNMELCHRERPAKGWADGSTEVFDVVPLIGEIHHSPNVRQIRLGK